MFRRSGNRQDPDINISKKTSAISDTTVADQKEAPDNTGYSLLAIKKQPFAFALRTADK